MPLSISLYTQAPDCQPPATAGSGYEGRSPMASVLDVPSVMLAIFAGGPLSFQEVQFEGSVRWHWYRNTPPVFLFQGSRWSVLGELTPRYFPMAQSVSQVGSTD